MTLTTCNFQTACCAISSKQVLRNLNLTCDLALFLAHVCMIKSFSKFSKILSIYKNIGRMDGARSYTTRHHHVMLRHANLHLFYV